MNKAVLPLPQSEHIEAFARRVLDRLPDSLKDQRNDLWVFIHLLPIGSPARSVAREMLEGIRIRDRAQFEFCHPDFLPSK